MLYNDIRFITKVSHYCFRGVIQYSLCYRAEIIGSSQRSLVTASDELKKTENLRVYSKVMLLWKNALLKVKFLKIPVLSCGDYWLITKVFSNWFRWAKEKWKLTGIWKSYVTLKVRPFESEFSQNPCVIVRRLLAHLKGL